MKLVDSPLLATGIRVVEKVMKMMDRDRKLTLLPPGVRVYMPEASRKKRKYIDDLFRAASRRGFDELDLPTLDYYDSITRGVSRKLGERTYQFQDDEGEKLALRPDATAQVAKILAGKFSPEELAGKYCYSCRNFRSFELRRGELREFQQFGVEILDDRIFSSDLQLLIFLLQRLQELQLDNVVVDLGHVQVYKGIIEEIELENIEKKKLWKEMYRKNREGLRKLLENCKITAEKKEILARLPEMYGGEEVFDRAEQIRKLSPTAARALDHLERLYDSLSRAGFGDMVSLDLSVVRDLDYYTGIVFEALVSGIGKPVAGGGRYDNLYENYGVQIPATGFALEIDRLLPVLEGEFVAGEERRVWIPEVSGQALQTLDRLEGENRLQVCFEEPPAGAEGLEIDAAGKVEEI